MRRTKFPPHRPLKTFAFDPSRGKDLGNHATIDVPFERLRPGPIGRRIAVVDFDPSNNVQYAPVDLDAPEILMGGGLEPSEANPQFHQQMVYAVAEKTLQHFDFALGRPVRWKKDARLTIYPHALREANAFYDPKAHALLFGYFRATELDGGPNLAGQNVFTCLSHDIIAHETTHAVLDSIRDLFSEETGPDSIAFHEAFADLVALFQHFQMSEVLVDTIRKSGGVVYRRALPPIVRSRDGEITVGGELETENPLIGLAWQFGTALGKRAALRYAIGTRADPKLLETTFEPHARGALLVAAVFDAFFTTYLRRTADLFQIAKIDRRDIGQCDISAELANRLADEVSTLAGHFLTMCIRALDYCPPVDMTFGDYLRAIVTADAELVPDDAQEYRAAIIDAFRRRGIRPDNARSYSEGSLLWDPPAKDTVLRRAEIAAQDDEDLAARATSLHAFVKQNSGVFCLDPELPIQVRHFRSIWRIGPDGQSQRRLIVELLQQRKEATADGSSFTFRGGTTAIFDAHRGDLLDVIAKPIYDANRLRKQQEFLEGKHGDTKAAYAKNGRAIDTHASFAAVHRGY